MADRLTRESHKSRKNDKTPNPSSGYMDVRHFIEEKKETQSYLLGKNSERLLYSREKKARELFL
jgi:hypothetical protein